VKTTTGRVDGRTVGRGRHCRRQAASQGGGGVAYEARGYKQAEQTDREQMGKPTAQIVDLKTTKLFNDLSK